MSHLTGKAALVTGGSRGIGAAIARHLARGGADVAITYVSAPDKANSVVADMESADRRRIINRFPTPRSRSRPMTSFRISNVASMLIVAIASLIMASQTAIAQDDKDQPWMIKPTEQHKILKKDVGTWDAAVKVWPMAGAEPMESKGIEKNRLLTGGLWLVTRFEGEVIGTPFIGMGSFGYDPAEKKYVGTWVDTMTPHMMTTKSDYDEKTKTMSGVSETRDPITGDKYTAKMITRYNDDGTRVMEMHRTGEDGKEWKVMEISYKRQPKQK